MRHDPRPRPTTAAPADRASAMQTDARPSMAWMTRHPPPARGRATGAGAPDPVRMVLDTNVSLDLIVFDDPRWTGLAGRIAAGACDVLMRADCRAEFARVLGYSQFGLDPDQRVRALRAFDAMHRFPLASECRTGPLDGLPRCRDPDDQKFIELAHQARAQVLLSKDKALLELDRRNRRAGLFEILSPQAWLQRQVAGMPGN